MKLVPIEMPPILTSAAYTDYLKYVPTYTGESEDEFKNAEGYIFPWGVIREEYLDYSECEGYAVGDGSISWYFYPTQVYDAILANREIAHPYVVMDFVQNLMVLILDPLPDEQIFIDDFNFTGMICLHCDVRDYEVAKSILEKYIVPKLPDLWRTAATWVRNSIETPAMAFFQPGKGSKSH